MEHPPDHHRPRNEECPQNSDTAQPCNCKLIRTRKPFRSIRVAGNDDKRRMVRIPATLVLQVWPNGAVGIRAKGSPKIYHVSAADIYARAVLSEALKLANERRAGKKKKRTVARR